MRMQIADLNPRQEKALQRLRQAPAPRPPLLKEAALTRLPLRYRLISFAAPLGLLLLIAGVLLAPFLTLPESWGTSLSLKAGGVIQVDQEKSLALDLPQIKGLIVFQGPGQMKVERLSRCFISGRKEAEFTLQKGQLYFDADPMIPKQILIHTPLLTIRVTGTQFLLGHETEQGSRLVVVRGEVEAMPHLGSGGWEPVPAGMILSVTPQGTIERQLLKKELPLDDFRLPVVSKRFGSSSGPEEEPSVNLHRILWHEE